MTDSLRVSLYLTEKEAESIKTIYDKLVDIDLFRDIPAESYSALDKFIKAINTELAVKANAANFRWGEKCGFCGHSSHDHAANGTGLCSSESCNCFKMVNTGVAA